MRYYPKRRYAKRVNGETVYERHEQWVGLRHVEQFGLPGYPAPRRFQPDVEPATEASVEEWGEVA